MNIEKGEQFDPDFLAIAPNNRIPAIIDGDNGLTLMESGAILLSSPRRRGGCGRKPSPRSGAWSSG